MWCVCVCLSVYMLFLSSIELKRIETLLNFFKNLKSCCVNYFSHCYNKMPHRDRVKEGGFPLIHGSSHHAEHHGDDSMW